jgi:neutral ceramidase
LSGKVDTTQYEAPWKAGLAKALITPQDSLWMAGYSSRNKPAEGIAQELYGKALSLEDCSGERAVLVATDLIGFPHWLGQSIAMRAQAGYGLSRDRLLLTSSHTHGGPVLDRMLAVSYDMSRDQWLDAARYTRMLEDKIVSLIGEALQKLEPARLGFGHAQAHFGVNRRLKTDQGWTIGVNPDGPVDHDVPVLRIEGHDGETKAVVFGYACHNTAAKDFMRFHGDYAGFAQAWLEKRYSRASALFIAGCGADINPHPRGTIELARKHGEELALAVDASLSIPLKAIGSGIVSAFDEFPLPFAAPPVRTALEEELQSGDVCHRRWAKAMLEVIETHGRIPDSYRYPLQVWRLGSSLTLIALAGEVVVDYVRRLKSELSSEELWVAAYCNDVFGYVPSLRVLQEGGYEGGGAMLYYGQPGSFAPSVEELIVAKVHELVNRVKHRETVVGNGSPI